MREPSRRMRFTLDPEISDHVFNETNAENKLQRIIGIERHQIDIAIIINFLGMAIISQDQRTICLRAITISSPKFRREIYR